MKGAKFRWVSCNRCGRDVFIKISPQTNVSDSYCLECEVTGLDNMPRESEGRGTLRNVDWHDGVPHEETGDDDWFSQPGDDFS